MQWLYQLSVTRRLAALVTLTLLSMLALLASRLRAVEGWCSIGNQCAMRGRPLIVFNNVYCIAG